MSVLNISLDAKQAKQVARLLANDTARTIMDEVATQSKSESELAKELNIPLSTIHYNMKHLKEAGLVVSQEFTYSEKGKKVQHYQLASEHIIISAAPEIPTAEILSGSAFAVVVAGIVSIVYSMNRASNSQATDTMMLQEVARTAAETTQAAAPAIWPWVLLGALCALGGVLAAWYVWRR